MIKTRILSSYIEFINNGSYLQPIFTWGKYYEEIQSGKRRILIPLSIQGHHDGFHVCKLVNELQSAINEI